MDMIEIGITYGNGYHCGCCRQTWDSVLAFYSLKDAQDFINTHAADQQIPVSEDADDVEIRFIREVEAKDLAVVPQSDVVERLLRERTDIRETKKKQDKKSEVETAKKEYERLKKELEENHNDTNMV